MGSRDRDAKGERDVLGRIAALLFALAGLADIAAGLPARRRREMLAILNFGEAAAWSLLTGMAHDAPFQDASVPAGAPGNCGDALMLAARFRLLALILATFPAQAVPSASQHAAVPHAAFPHAAGREPFRQARRQATSPAPDTS